MTDRKLDIFWLLEQLNSTDAGDIYAKLTPEQRTGFAPLVVMRWMSGCSDERQIVLLNEFVNTAVFSLGRHPHLLCQLLQVCNSHQRRRYQWLGQRRAAPARAAGVVAAYWGMSTREVRLMDPMPPAHEILSMAEELGMESAEIAQLKKELNE